MKSLRDVNIEVNSSCKWVTDQDQFGMAEYWEDNLANNNVDCEDAAIRKYHLLRAEGYDKDLFKLGFCRVDGVGHLVLIVKSGRTDMVLDNLLPYPTPWDMVPYEWDRFYVVSEGKWRWYKKS